VFLALRDLRFAKGRLVLVGTVIALVALMSTLLSGLANGLVDDSISGLRRLPLAHLAFQPGAETTFSRSTPTTENLTQWLDVERVDASPMGVSFFNAKTADGATIDMALFGIPPDSFLTPPGKARESRALLTSGCFSSLGYCAGLASSRSREWHQP
jgi:putative ABC transport system permease protein